MPVARVVPHGPHLAEVLVDAGEGSWRRVLRVEGPDAEARGRLLGQLLEAGVLVTAAALADPVGRAVALEPVADRDAKPANVRARVERAALAGLLEGPRGLGPLDVAEGRRRAWAEAESIVDEQLAQVEALRRGGR
jgi:hypothetical protein